jgi:membrane protein implicated in regulation of membrane protease activity
MALRDRPRLRLLLLWVVFAAAALLLMLTGTVLDASGARWASLFSFFLASVCIAALLIVRWRRRRDRD